MLVDVVSAHISTKLMIESPLMEKISQLTCFTVKGCLKRKGMTDFPKRRKTIGIVSNTSTNSCKSHILSTVSLEVWEGLAMLIVVHFTTQTHMTWLRYEGLNVQIFKAFLATKKSRRTGIQAALLKSKSIMMQFCGELNMQKSSSPCRTTWKWIGGCFHIKKKQRLQRRMVR